MREAYKPPLGMSQLQSTVKIPIPTGMEEDPLLTELSAQCHICTEFPCGRNRITAPFHCC